MVRVAAASRAGVVVMHMQGTPQTMQHKPLYRDVVEEVSAFFEGRIRALQASGVEPDRVALDPGFGFGKTLEHNVALLRGIPQLCRHGRPLLVGVSRKSMLGRLVESEMVADRFWPTVAITSLAREMGAGIVRVHDVRPNREAMRMTEAILEADGAACQGG